MDVNDFEKLIIVGVLPLRDCSKMGGSGQNEGESIWPSTGSLWRQVGRYLGGLLRRRQ